MDVYYKELELPTGPALAAATVRGITRLELNAGNLDAWLARLAEEFGNMPVEDDRPFKLLSGELMSYFAGRLRVFTVRLDVRGTPFQGRVWRALMSVPYGAVVTYGELARMAGVPDAARAVGGAMNRNRVPIIIPCHRVVAAGGKIGGYGGGLDIKRALLEVEGVRPPYGQLRNREAA